MVRKQIYILDEQEALLKRAAGRNHTSEAEIIRAGLDRILRGSGGTPRDPAAWDRLKDAMDHCGRAGARSARKRWNREELYDRPVLR